MPIEADWPSFKHMLLIWDETELTENSDINNDNNQFTVNDKVISKVDHLTYVGCNLKKKIGSFKRN